MLTRVGEARVPVHSGATDANGPVAVAVAAVAVVVAVLAAAVVKLPRNVGGECRRLFFFPRELRALASALSASMLTRGREARVAVRPEAAHGALVPLHLPLFLEVLSRLAPGERLLASAVSRGWRAAVCEPCLWASVDLTQGASDALLRFVVRKAARQITSLRLHLCRGELSKDAAMAAVTACGGALRHLELLGTPSSFISDVNRSFINDADRVCLSKDDVDFVLHAAPGLVSFHTDVKCSFQNAQSLLAGQGQYSVVHLRRLIVPDCFGQEVSLLTHAIRQHSSLRELGLSNTRLGTSGALGALVDAAIECGLTGLRFSNCAMGPTFCPHSAVHLARLLRDAPRLSTLLIDTDSIFDPTSTSVLAAALRASPSLTHLCLDFHGLWMDTFASSVLLDALVGHPTLQDITFANNGIPWNDPQKTVGSFLARLVAANSPSLRTLSLYNCYACEDVLRPLFEALQSNTFLRELSLWRHGLSEPYLSAPFARDVLLP